MTQIGISKVLIRTYGLFWKPEDVFWGGPNKKGSLLGIHSLEKKSKPVDFREQIGIYVLYADYKIVYIGQAGQGNRNLFDRLKEHFIKDDLVGRWNRFSWFGIKWVTNVDKLSVAPKNLYPPLDILLNHIEAILIHASEPPLNRQGGKWGSVVEKYFQYRDEKLGPKDSEAIQKLLKIKDSEK